MIICDTGPLVAAADRDEQHNRACTDLLTGLHLAGRAILVPAPVVAEVGYLLARIAGELDEDTLTRMRRIRSNDHPSTGSVTIALYGRDALDRNERFSQSFLR